MKKKKNKSKREGESELQEYRGESRAVEKEELRWISTLLLISCHTTRCIL